MRANINPQSITSALHHAFGIYVLGASIKAVFIDKKNPRQIAPEQQYDMAVTKRALEMKGYHDRDFMFVFAGTLIMRAQEERLTPHDRVRARWSLALEQATSAPRAGRS